MECIFVSHWLLPYQIGMHIQIHVPVSSTFAQRSLLHFGYRFFIFIRQESISKYSGEQKWHMI